LEEWPIWRLVLQGKATLQELETIWDYDDVVRANISLDIMEKIQEVSMEKMK
jgi:hypothetical protein